MILGFLLIILAEVPVLVAGGEWRTLRAFGLLLLMGFSLSLMMVERWPVPNPNQLLRAIFEPVSDLLGIK